MQHAGSKARGGVIHCNTCMRGGARAAARRAGGRMAGARVQTRNGDETAVCRRPKAVNACMLRPHPSSYTHGSIHCKQRLHSWPQCRARSISWHVAIASLCHPTFLGCVLKEIRMVCHHRQPSEAWAATNGASGLRLHRAGACSGKPCTGEWCRLISSNNNRDGRAVGRVVAVFHNPFQ